MEFKEYTEKAIDKLIDLAERQREVNKLLEDQIKLQVRLKELQIKDLSDRIDKLENT